MNILETFARDHRLKLTADGVIHGRRGRSEIYEYSDSLLAVVIQPDIGTSQTWNTAAAAFKAVGMVISQDGEREGIALFSPDDKQHVVLALKYAKITPKRRVAADVGQRLHKSVGKQAVERLPSL
jgi:hypothetical protein